MTQNTRTSDLLAQIEMTKQKVNEWPQWMRDSASVVSATLPVKGSVDKDAGSQSSPRRDTNKRSVD